MNLVFLVSYVMILHSAEVRHRNEPFKKRSAVMNYSLPLTYEGNTFLGGGNLHRANSHLFKMGKIYIYS